MQTTTKFFVAGNTSNEKNAALKMLNKETHTHDAGNIARLEQLYGVALLEIAYYKRRVALLKAYIDALPVKRTFRSRSNLGHNYTTRRRKHT